MHVLRTIADVRAHLAPDRRAGRSIGFVPTMGALHEGHFSLVDAARRDCDVVVVSIFVNPTQFGPGEDLAKYPRREQADLAGCEAAGVDVVFAPTVEEMWGRGSETTVCVPSLADHLCGRSRPGHFDGVCTVVAKLLNIVQPDRAYFGAKDYQQATILRRMVVDLNIPVEMVVCPIVREADGLALSSRNAYLTPAERQQAPALHESLLAARESIESSSPPATDVAEAIRAHLAARAPDGEVDYVEIVDPETLEDVERTDRPVLIALAMRLGKARLIDNLVVDSPGPGH